MTQAVAGADFERCVLVFAPVGRDGELTQNLLDRASIPCYVCTSIAVLTDKLEAHGAVLLLTEEALDDPNLPDLLRHLDNQPPWSDLPVLMLAGAPGSDMTVRALRSMETLRNVTLLERPIRIAAVVSAVRAARRSRDRQYEVRDLLVALHRARADAEAANRLKDEFLATLSHELRTPLNAILGWTSMLARGQIDAARLPHVFQVLDRNAQSQAQLIADVLDVSRIVTGKLHLHMRIADVCEIVGLAADAVRPTVLAKQITLTVHDAPDCLVQGDPERLQQIFWNLFSNAAKFTPAGGLVTANITRHASTITVAVSDSGVGIAEDFVPFVFDRFRQADQTTTRAYGGLGLGLSIVKHLTELHGGTIGVSSAGLGRGARFEVRLPAVDISVADRPGHDGMFDAIRLDGRTILIVDDDESNREVVAAALQAAHANVDMAASAAEARERLQEREPELIIADLAMPIEDGFSLMRDVRRGRAAAVPAIALSAYADQASRDAALAAGFTEFLAKPARADTLLALVARLLNARASAD